MELRKRVERNVTTVSQDQREISLRISRGIGMRRTSHFLEGQLGLKFRTCCRKRNVRSGNAFHKAKALKANMIFTPARSFTLLIKDRLFPVISPPSHSKRGYLVDVYHAVSQYFILTCKYKKNILILQLLSG